MLVLISIQMKGWIYDMMELMRASEVAKELSVSTSYAYSVDGTLLYSRYL